MRVYIAILLSLSIHLILALGAAFFPAIEPQYEVVELDVINTNTTQNRSVVRNVQAPQEQIKDWSKDPSQYLSEQTQRVKEQLRAIRIGISKNRGNVKKLIPKPEYGLNKTHNENNRFDEEGFSSLGNQVDEKIKIGGITALNTDRYIYYTYYSRAEELVRYYWEAFVRNLEQNTPATMQASIHRRFTTDIEVRYKPSGEFLSVHLLKASGVAELDFIAMESFRRVKMIPNPPKDKIDTDGIVKIPYSLTVNYTPKVLGSR